MATRRQRSFNFPYGYWPVGASMELYAEVGGIKLGSVYRTTVEVEPIIPGRRGIKIQGDAKASTPVVELRRTIGLGNLRPGGYRLSVTVESDGSRTRRDQEVIIVK